MEDLSRLEGAIQTLVCVFHEYAAKDYKQAGKGHGKEDCEKAFMDQFNLSKGELKELLQKELNMDNVSDPKKLDAIMMDLDDNKDGQVDFKEFVVLVAAMSCACNDFFQMLQSEEHK